MAGQAWKSRRGLSRKGPKIPSDGSRDKRGQVPCATAVAERGLKGGDAALPGKNRRDAKARKWRRHEARLGRQPLQRQTRTPPVSEGHGHGTGRTQGLRPGYGLPASRNIPGNSWREIQAVDCLK